MFWKHPYKPTADCLIFGGINTDYPIESNWQKQLASLLAKYNLSHTRIQNNPSTAIDNIFVDNSRINLSSISPIINGPSDHDAQISQLYIYIHTHTHTHTYIYIYVHTHTYATINRFPLKQRTRLIDNEAVMNFQTVLKKPGNLFQ